MASPLDHASPRPARGRVVTLRRSGDRVEAGPGRPPDEVLGELKAALRRKAPELAGRGPEDPAWVFLEAVAEALGEVEGRVDLMEERIFPRVLESLGDEPRWASGACTPL